jgi:hypothetical protein
MLIKKMRMPFRIASVIILAMVALAHFTGCVQTTDIVIIEDITIVVEDNEVGQ